EEAMDVPRTMRAIALRRFGGIDALEPQTLPVPSPGPHEVLVDVAFAAVGEWDAFEREGRYARLPGTQATFPYVLGSEGAGTVAAVGDGVERFRVGDRVYAVGFLNPRGGFYAEYAAVREDLVASIPGELPLEQAAALGGVGITALRGLEDVLAIAPRALTAPRRPCRRRPPLPRSRARRVCHRPPLARATLAGIGKPAPASWHPCLRRG